MSKEPQSDSLTQTNKKILVQSGGWKSEIRVLQGPLPLKALGKDPSGLSQLLAVPAGPRVPGVQLYLSIFVPVSRGPLPRVPAFLQAHSLG